MSVLRLCGGCKPREMPHPSANTFSYALGAADAMSWQVHGDCLFQLAGHLFTPLPIGDLALARRPCRSLADLSTDWMPTRVL